MSATLAPDQRPVDFGADENSAELAGGHVWGQIRGRLGDENRKTILNYAQNYLDDTTHLFKRKSCGLVSG
jgi:hypothetical protein